MKKVQPATLTECLKDARIIGTLGTCKNAGKTTVLNYLLDTYHEQCPVGITSIGYDGEATDAVTLLPKPRIKVYPGMLVATAASCLETAEAKFEYLVETPIHTVVGRIHIVRITHSGIMEVAGPSMVSQLDHLCKEMLELGCEKVIADGAAGRISFGVIADSVVLSVGAAMSNTIGKTVETAAHLAGLLSLEPIEGITKLKRPENAVYDVTTFKGNSCRIYRGAVGDQDMESCPEETNIVIRNAAAAFISPMVYKKFLHHGGKLLVQEPIPIRALTINPMTPYGPWYNQEQFMEQMTGATFLPVYNVKDR